MIRLRTNVQSSKKKGHFGRIGVIVQRQTTGHLFALTSAHAVNWGLVKDLTDSAIGIRTAGQVARPTMMPRCADLVAFVRLSENVDLDLEPQRHLTKIARPLDVLGEEIGLLNKDDEVSIGRVSSVQATVAMVDAERGTSVSYAEAILVKVLKPDAVDGEAGSVCCTGDGKIVGMVLGRGEQMAILCPFDRLWREESFQVAYELPYKPPHDPFPALYRACVDGPEKLPELLNASRSDFHNYFRLLSSWRGRQSMEFFQNEVAHTLFRLVGFPLFAECLQALTLRSDAPYDNVNDNWLWRASIERLRLLIPASDGKTLTCAELPEMFSAVQDVGDVGLARGLAADRASQAAPATARLNQIADSYLGKNDVEFIPPDEEPAWQNEPTN